MNEINSSELRKAVKEANCSLRNGPLDTAIDRLKYCVEIAREAGDPIADVFEAFIVRLTPAFEIWDEAEREFDATAEVWVEREFDATAEAWVER
jgi:hypothetical protein